MSSESAPTPRSVRNQIAREIKEHVDADEVCFCTFTLVDRVNYYTSFTGALSPDVQQAVRRAEGQASLCHRFWRPSMTPLDERDRFQRCDYGIDELEQCDEPIIREVYAPLGITQTCKMRLYDGPRFLGFVICSRRGASAQSFNDVELARLNALTERVRTQVLRAERLEMDLPSPAYAMFDASRRAVEWASPGVHPWFDERRLDALRAALDQRALPSFVVLDSRVLRFTALEGGDGSRVMVSIARGDEPRLAPRADLTPAQRDVAGYAAVGATNPEIARHLGISPETVKTHIKNIYNRLGIGSRLELSQLLAS